MPTAKTAQKPVTRSPRKRPAPSSRQAKSAASTATAKLPATTSKPKLVRDSFTIPKSEYVMLESLKLRAAGLMRPVKKSELLRAGIKALAAMSDRSLLSALDGVPSLKTGRPKALEEAAPPTKAGK